ncbi:MAG: nucleotidyltransferase family protein [Dictyoglomus sp.]|jgi:predicted nucleotidyltransferase|uniref:nucleotidyltransferase family protein n=1 Tax=Dictyoglomus sp. TaxID=28205 RepID=UPI003CA56ED9
MDVKEIRKKLEEKKDYLKKEFYVVEIGIFGSFVRNEQTSTSDVDILIVFEKGHKNFFNYMRLKYYLEDLLGLQVDLVIKEAIKLRLRENILKEVEYV